MSELHIDITDQSQVLYQSTGPGDGLPQCAELFISTELSQTSVLLISLTDDAETLCDRWQSHIGVWPDEMFILVVGFGDHMDSFSVDRPSSHTKPGEIDCVSAVKRVPSVNYSKVGNYTIQLFDKLREAENDIAVCFDSVTALMPYTERKEIVVEFLYKLGRQVEDIGGHIHYHVDPIAVDDQVIAKADTFSTLVAPGEFDAVS